MKIYRVRLLKSQRYVVQNLALLLFLEQMSVCWLVARLVCWLVLRRISQKLLGEFQIKLVLRGLGVGQGRTIKTWCSSV